MSEREKAENDMALFGTGICQMYFENGEIKTKRIEPRDFYKKPTLWQRIKWWFADLKYKVNPKQ